MRKTPIGRCTRPIEPGRQEVAMIRILLRCDYLSVLPKLQEKLKKSGFLPVGDGEDAALFVPQLTKSGWEREVLARTLRGGAVVVVKKENIRCSQVIDRLYEVGLTETKTPAHNTVRVYNRERTLCDILKKSNQIDIQLITQAFKEYTMLPDKNVALLSESLVIEIVTILSSPR